MKAISILQPWASLIAIGAKKIETRSWPTKYRGPLAIHASAGYTKKRLTEAVIIEPFRTALRNGGIERIGYFPLGAVIATCNLVDCIKIFYVEKDWAKLRNVNGALVTGNEFLFGDYTPGRFAWILKDVRPLPEPVPAKGQLGLWNWEVPEGGCC